MPPTCRVAACWNHVVDDDRRRVGLDPAQYDRRWSELAASGHGVHGEADLVAALLPSVPDSAVLDAGCGTGRVAIELARRGCSTVGIDVDATLLARAREKAPQLAWVEADLAALTDDVAPGPFDAVVLAGNVMIFVARGTEGKVLANLAERTAPGGLVIAGFQLSTGRVGLDEYDHLAREAGLVAVARWSTWDQDAYDDGAEYLVAVDRKVDPDRSRSSSS
jgi:SAM-dependent methyltransferase